MDEYCHFRKHPGRLWTDVLEDDRSYIEWLVSGDGDQPDLAPELYDYLIDLLEEDDG